MIPVLLPRSEEIPIARDIQSLESQLLDLEERFNVIVKWIQSNYYKLRGLPENVVTAILGPSKNTDNINRNKIEPQANKSTFDEVDDSDGIRTLNISCETEDDQSENKNPVVQLDKLTLRDVESLTEQHSITNLKAIKTSLSKAGNSEGSNLLICDSCQKRFKLRIHLKKHKAACHWREDNVPLSKRKMSKPQTKKRRNKIRKLAIEEDAYAEILQFPVTSDEESDLGSVYDPLGDINTDDSESDEDHLKPGDENNIGSFDVDSSFTIKDEVEELEIEIKEETTEDCSFSTIEQETEQVTKKRPREDSKSITLNRKMCKRTFKHPLVLKSHETTHSSSLTKPKEGKRSSTKYKCDQCETFFSNKRKCIRHVKTHIKSPVAPEKVVFKCELCEKSFETQKICNTHLKICLGIYHPNVLENEEGHLGNLNSSNKSLTEEPGLEKPSINSEAVQEESAQSEENTRVTSTTTVADPSKENQPKLKPQKKSAEKETDEDLNFICNICANPFKNLHALKHHKRIHLRPEVLIQDEDYLHPNYRCLKCDQVFTAKTKFISHVKSLCGTKELKPPRKRNNRKPIVDSEKDGETSVSECNDKSGSIICEICGRTFMSKNGLKSHMHVHTGKKDHLCTECGKRFARFADLKTHQLGIHSNERKYKCQYCESTFKLKFVRNKHEKLHLGVLKVNCDICGYTFSNKQSLKMHIKGVHENQRSYQCHLCDKSFKTSTSRKYHVKTHDNPNGRKRGLNKDTDHMKAADKRNRWQKNTSENVVQQ